MSSNKRASSAQKHNELFGGRRRRISLDECHRCRPAIKHGVLGTTQSDGQHSLVFPGLLGAKINQVTTRLLAI
jgi:hypothetical protein